MFVFIRKLTGLAFIVAGVLKLIYYQFPQLGKAIDTVNQHFTSGLNAFIGFLKMASPGLGNGFGELVKFLATISSSDVPITQHYMYLVWGILFLFTGIILYIMGHGTLSFIADIIVTIWFGYWLIKGLETFDSSLGLALIIVYNLTLFIYFLKNTLNDVSYMIYAY